MTLATFGCAAMAVAAAAVPSLEDLAGNWLDLTGPISAHANASLLDLPIISNFHGSVGSSPNGQWAAGHSSGGTTEGGVRPVDLFAPNSLEIPPFAGCGNSAAHGTPNGCGRLLINGVQVEATHIKYQADQVARQSRPAGGGGLTVSSKMRMLFEEPGVLWLFNLSNPTDSAVTVDFELELALMVNEFAHVAWVLELPYDPANFTYTELGGDPGHQSQGLGGAALAGSGLRGVQSVGKPELNTASMLAAAAVFAFADEDPAFALPPAAGATSGIPRAMLNKLTIPAGSNRLVRAAMTIASQSADAQALASSVVSTVEVCGARAGWYWDLAGKVNTDLICARTAPRCLTSDGLSATANGRIGGKKHSTPGMGSSGTVEF